MREPAAGALLFSVAMALAGAASAAAAVELRPRDEAWAPAERLPASAREAGQAIGLVFGARLGEAVLGADWSDFRGQPIAAGRYGLRYALQPRLKDHVGVDAIRDFAILVPPELAAPADAKSPEEWIAASRRVSGSTHPAVMALVAWPEGGPPPAGPVGRGERVVEYRTIGDLVIGFVVAGRAPRAEAF